MLIVGVEKVRDWNVFLVVSIAAPSFLFSPQLGGYRHSGYCRVAEQPHKSLEVLGRRCQEELLPNELHPT